MKIVNRGVNFDYDTNPSSHHKFNAQLLKPYIGEKDTLLDVGCWTGQLGGFLKKHCHVVGIDIWDEPLQLAKKLHPEAKFYKASVFEIPFPNSTFSLVAFNDVIEHLPIETEKKALKEINRVITPGGKLLLTTMLDHPFSKILDPAWLFGHRHYSEKYLRDLINNSGFRVLKIYKTGGFTRAISHILELFYKHIIGKKLNFSNKIEKIIEREYNCKNGFYEIHIIAEAK